MRQPLGPLRPRGMSGVEARPLGPGGYFLATRGPAGHLLATNTDPGWTLFLASKIIKSKGGDDMTLPGIITNQPMSGRQVGQAVFQFLPALPGEGPPGMPRTLAKQLFPRGFFPGMIPAIPALPAAARPAPPVQPLIPPAGIPVQPPAPAANQVVTQPPPKPVQPAPPTGYRSAAQGGEAIRTSSQRIRVRERPGL